MASIQEPSDLYGILGLTKHATGVEVSHAANVHFLPANVYCFAAYCRWRTNRPVPRRLRAASQPRLCAHIRRTYRTLVSRFHPDKTGAQNAELFQAIQHAYEVLSDSSKRQLYDATGTWEKGAEEELLESFGGGEDRSAIVS
eukprot:1162029-Pelagomonas_calceolata.AAC.2